MTPWRRAKTKACCWEWTSSFERMLVMWLRSVRRLMCSLSAIPLLSKPLAKACRTSISRGEARYGLVGLVLLLSLGSGEAEHQGARGPAACRSWPVQPSDGLAPRRGGGDHQASPREHLRQGGRPREEPSYEQGPCGAMGHHARRHR